MRFIVHILVVFVILAGCRREHLEEVKFREFVISEITLHQLPEDNFGTPWDNGTWDNNPDVFLVFKDLDGIVYHVTESYQGMDWTWLPFEYWTYFDNPTLPYRKQIIVDILDEDDGDFEVIASLSFFPFLEKIEDRHSSITLSDGRATLKFDAWFYE